MKVHRIDHVGINVENIAAAKEFFLAIGMKVVAEMEMGGELVERVIGLPNVKDSMVMMGTDGEAMIELVQFHSPKDTQGVQHASANTLGIRHICMAVEDVDAAVAAAKEHGGELMGEVVNYQNVYKLCYIRGPEGIILELAEKIGQ